MTIDDLARLATRVGRRPLLRALAVTPVALLLARFSRPAAAQFCAADGGICVASIPCCNGAPCVHNLAPGVGVCGADLPTAGEATGTDTPGGGDNRIADDGNALGPRAQVRHRRRRRRDLHRKRRDKRHDRRDRNRR